MYLSDHGGFFKKYFTREKLGVIEAVLCESGLGARHFGIANFTDHSDSIRSSSPPPMLPEITPAPAESADAVALNVIELKK